MNKHHTPPLRRLALNLALSTFIVLAVSLLAACQTTGDSGQKQAVINYSAKAALTGSVTAILKNNEDYREAFSLVSNELNRLSWEGEGETAEEVVAAIKERLQSEGTPSDQINKIVVALASGLSIYDEYIRANPDGGPGQNGVLNALSSGIERALLAGLVFDDGGGGEPNPFTL